VGLFLQPTVFLFFSIAVIAIFFPYLLEQSIFPNNVASMHPLAKASGFLGEATDVEPETMYPSYD